MGRSPRRPEPARRQIAVAMVDKQLSRWRPLSWVALGWVVLACRATAPLPAVPATPTSRPPAPAAATSRPAATPTHVPLPTATASLVPGQDWQAVEAAGLELHHPPTWERLEAGTAGQPTAFPDAALRLAERQGAVQIGVWCLSHLDFSETFGGLSSSPSAAGEALWEYMARHYASTGQADGLAVEGLAEFSLADQPAVQVQFSAPGLRQPIGVENPMEGDQPEATYYKSLTLVMTADQVCYAVVTAMTEAAREQPVVAAILASLRLTP